MKLTLATLATLAGTAALGAAAALTAPAAAQPPPPAASPCFDYADMRGHSFSPDNKLIYINVAGREVFQLDVAGSCLGGAISSDPLVIVRRGGGPSVCRPIDLDISVRGAGGFPKQCIVQSIRRLTPAEVAALPPKVRP